MPAGPDDDSCLTFFFDRSIGKAVPEALRAVRVHAVSHDDHYPAQRRVPDETWIAEQTELGHVLVTKDKGIQHRASEVAAIRSAEARLLVLTDRRANKTPNVAGDHDRVAEDREHRRCRTDRSVDCHDQRRRRVQEGALTCLTRRTAGRKPASPSDSSPSTRVRTKRNGSRVGR